MQRSLRIGAFVGVLIGLSRAAAREKVLIGEVFFESGFFGMMATIVIGFLFLVGIERICFFVFAIEVVAHALFLPNLLNLIYFFDIFLFGSFGALRF